MDSSSADQRLPHRREKHIFSRSAWQTVATPSGSLIYVHSLVSGYGRQVPDRPVSPQQLRELGVLCWRLDADAYRTDPRLRAIREARGYSYEVRRFLASSGGARRKRDSALVISVIECWVGSGDAGSNRSVAGQAAKL